MLCKVSRKQSLYLLKYYGKNLLEEYSFICLSWLYGRGGKNW
jgi:hypothetical protein